MRTLSEISIRASAHLLVIACGIALLQGGFSQPINLVAIFWLWVWGLSEFTVGIFSGMDVVKDARLKRFRERRWNSKWSAIYITSIADIAIVSLMAANGMEILGGLTFGGLMLSWAHANKAREEVAASSSVS